MIFSIKRNLNVIGVIIIWRACMIEINSGIPAKLDMKKGLNTLLQGIILDDPHFMTSLMVHTVHSLIIQIPF